jgi:hypothetical protein
MSLHHLTSMETFLVGKTAFFTLRGDAVERFLRRIVQRKACAHPQADL